MDSYTLYNFAFFDVFFGLNFPNFSNSLGFSSAPN